MQVTDVHILIYNTMMACGITPHEVFRSVLPTQVPEELPTPKKALFISKPTTDSKRVAAADLPAPGSSLPNVKQISSGDKNPATEEVDAKKTPKRLTQKHMLQWMADRNGVRDLLFYEWVILLNFMLLLCIF